MLNSEYTDTQLLDYLQELLEDGGYSNRCVLRLSESGRGFRLHETSRDNGVRDVRQAIINFMKRHRGLDT